jgi:hypothetical protein
MEGAHQRRAVLQLELAVPELGDAERASGQQLRGEVSERHDQLRVDEVELGFEERLTGFDLCRQRIAVSRRAAAERVRDVHIRAFQTEFLLDQLGQQLSGRPDERLALLVLVVAGGLAHEDQVGVRVADAEDRACADVAQRTRTACLGLLR